MIWEERFVGFTTFRKYCNNLLPGRMCSSVKWIFNSKKLNCFLRGMAYAMYYKANGRGIEPRCPDYETLFSKAIQSRITAKASNGQVITVSYAIESALVTESAAFSFDIQLTEPISQSHISILQKQLSEKWTAQLSGKIYCKKHCPFYYRKNCKDYLIQQLLHLILSATGYFLSFSISQCYAISLFQNPW